MNEEVADLWTRARRALQTGESLIESDPDAAASRAYYAAFNAVRQVSPEPLPPVDV